MGTIGFSTQIFLYSCLCLCAGFLAGCRPALMMGYSNPVSPVEFNGISSIDSISSTAMRINWIPVSGVMIYQVYQVSSQGDFSVGFVPAGLANSLTLSNLSPSTAYSFQVNAIDFNGLKDANRNVLSATTLTMGASAVTLGSISLSQSTFLMSASSISAGSVAVLILTLKDPLGNAVEDIYLANNLSFSVLSSGTSSGTVGPITAVPGVPGSYQAIFTATTAGTVNAFQASLSGYGSFSVTPSLIVTSGAVSAANSGVTASPSSISDINSVTSTVTVTLRDAHNSPVSGKTVTLASNRSGNDTISLASGSSTVSGQVTFTVKSNLAGTSTYTATDITDSVTVSQTASVTHTSGPVSASLSTVSVPAAAVTANNTDTSIVTVTLLDATGNPVLGKSVNLTSSRPGSDTILTLFGTTNSLGQATFSIRSSASGISVVTARDSTDSLLISQTGLVTFVSGSVDVAQSTLTPLSSTTTSPPSTTVTVTLKDAFGNPVPGKAVSLTSSRTSSDSISAPSGVSSSTGTVSFQVSSFAVGSSVYTATDITDSLTISQTAHVTYQGLLVNQLATSPTFAFSLRQLSSTASNALQVRRSNDSAVLDIGFTPAGDLDQTNLLNFVTVNGTQTSNSGYVTKWYNQIGSGDLTQTTVTYQPIIVQAGTVEQFGSKTGIRFQGIDGGNPNFLAYAGLSTVSYVAAVTERDPGNYGFLLSDLVNYYWHSAVDVLFTGGYCATIVCGAGTLAHVNGTSYAPATNAPYLSSVLNIISVETTSNGASSSWSNIGSDRLNFHNFSGFYMEAIVFSNPISSSDQNLIYASQASYWQ